MALSLKRELLERPTPEDLEHVCGGITARKTTRRTVINADGSWSETDAIDIVEEA